MQLPKQRSAFFASSMARRNGQTLCQRARLCCRC
ncbi:hypothetical protein RHECNPAF_122100148 [Rhizobium etli CNPAF512]|nr:hypothetical protein RHECNPAF_122100148 [Rhizobium etli CNPAF512]